jgi:hypothetical protein
MNAAAFAVALTRRGSEMMIPRVGRPVTPQCGQGPEGDGTGRRRGQAGPAVTRIMRTGRAQAERGATGFKRNSVFSPGSWLPAGRPSVLAIRPGRPL